MSKNERLAKNTLIIFIGKFCTQFMSFLLLPLLTAVLTVGEYGKFDLISTYAWLITPIMTMQIDNGIFRFLIDSRKDDKESESIITNGLISSFINICLFTIIYIPLTIIFKIENGSIIYLYSLSITFLNFPLQIARGKGDNLSYSIASIVVGISNLLLCILAVCILNKGFYGMMIAGIFSNICGGGYLIYKKRIYKCINFKLKNKRQSLELIKYSLPLVPNSISSWIISISDKVMISLFIGTGANGIYSVATRFSILLSHMYSVFNLSWTESASVSSSDSDREEFFSSAIDGIFGLCACICLMILSAMPIIFEIMIDSNYSEAYNYIPYLIMGSMLEIFSGLLGAIYISMKSSNKIAVSTFLSGIINITINIIFLKKYGIIVACLSTITAYVFLTLYRLVDIKKVINLKFNHKKNFLIVIMTLLLSITYNKKSISISIVSTTFTIMISIIINRKILIGFYNKALMKYKILRGK